MRPKQAPGSSHTNQGSRASGGSQTDPLPVPDVGRSGDPSTARPSEHLEWRARSLALPRVPGPLLQTKIWYLDGVLSDPTLKCNTETQRLSPAPGNLGWEAPGHQPSRPKLQTQTENGLSGTSSKMSAGLSK